MKPRAATILDELGVGYELRRYPLEREMSAQKVADAVGVPLGQVFKTLVAKGNRHGPCLAVVPADRGLDLKALAKQSGNRKATLVALEEIERLTGYVRGGVTALGVRTPLPVYLDVSADGFDRISVSAGEQGAQLLLAPGDYVRATGARRVAIAREPGE